MPWMSAFLRVGFVMLVCPGFALGCSSSETPAPQAPSDEISFEIFPTTTILTDAELAGLDSSPDGTLTFTSAPASLQNVAAGSVIVAGLSGATPQGLLRAVTGVHRNGAGLALSTMQAPIALAFRKLHVKSQRDATGFGAAPWNRSDLSPRSLQPQGELIGGNVDAEQPVDFLLFDGDNDPSTTNDQIGIHGSIGGGFHYGISVDVDWGDVFDLPNAVKTCIASVPDIFTGKLPDCSLTALLPEVKVAFEANPFMKAHASLYGAASLSYEKELNIATIPLSPIPIGPLVFVPSVDITAKIGGSAGAGFTVGAHGMIKLESSVAISSKHPESPDITPIAIKQVDFTADETKVILQASAKVGVGARLNVELYGIVGPYAQATAYAEVKADAFANPCWALHVGVDTVLGIRVTSPTIPFFGSVTLLDWKGLELTPIDQVISSGDCLPVEKGPSLPPGSGPDAVTYANPSFTPWALVTSPVGDDGAINSFLVDGLEWTDSTPAIDGRHVISGSRNDSVIKLDEAGTILWSRRLRREAGSPPLLVRRAVSTHDASMLILAEAQDGDRASVLKLGESGGIWFRKSIELDPAAGCSFEPFGLARDTNKGFFVLATCLGDERAAVAHLDENAEVIGVQLFGDPVPKERWIVPSALTTMGDGVVVLGASATVTEGTRMFGIRLSGGGDTVWANRIIGCPKAPDLHPSQARTNDAGQLTIVGTAADHRDGMVMRIKDDGSLAFANFSRFDEGGDQPFNIHAFAELPTTGMMVAGSTSNLGLPSGQPGTESSLLLASLDSTGRTLWARRYTLPNLRALNHASLHVTDDGGVLVTGIAQHTSQPGGGLFAMKAFAKNGDLGGAPGVSVVAMAAFDPLPCPVTVAPWPAVVTSASAITAEVPAIAEDAKVQLE